MKPRTNKQLAAELRKLRAENRKLEQVAKSLERKLEDDFEEDVRIRGQMWDKSSDLIIAKDQKDLANATYQERLRLAKQRMQLAEKQEKAILTSQQYRRRVLVELDASDIFNISITSPL